MSISKELVCAFQGLYESKFGQSLSYQEAEHQLASLAQLIRLINN